jgi:glucans biosynthesis protein
MPNSRGERWLGITCTTTAKSAWLTICSHAARQKPSCCRAVTQTHLMAERPLVFLGNQIMTRRHLVIHVAIVAIANLALVPAPPTVLAQEAATATAPRITAPGASGPRAAEPQAPAPESNRHKTARLRTVGQAQPFDFAWLKGHARELAAQPYHAPPAALPEPIAHLTWDQMQAIHFKEAHALWQDEAAQFRIRFFHLGLYNKLPVKIFELRDGQARQLAYDPTLFEYGKSGVDGGQLPADLGFAGFQIFHQADWRRDVAAFQGASYFRAVGEGKQYGLSARGLAVDCGLARAEEFPNFTAYWLERPSPKSDRLTIYALLDSPSVAGAYRFVVTPGEPLKMEIDAAIYPRKSIEVLGVAPLTSMFQCGENDRRVGSDWRPEIHDSDGLSMWTGAGEWIWRPLVNPSRVRVNSFQDQNPRGFGLLERDRSFDHFQDDGVYYDRRPSVWVEPKEDAQGWGKGAVRLVEIPTPDETFDNIVTFWTPAEHPQPGAELLFSYRLFWGNKSPHTSPLATVQATRTGMGGVIGQQRKYFSWRFAVDFAGGELASLPADAKVEPVITASRGEIEITSARPLTAIDGWRAMFDVKPTDDSVEPIDLRLYLRHNDKPLTETWIYQWTPPEKSERKF